MKNKRVTKLFSVVVAGLMISGGSLSLGQSPRRAKSVSVSKYGALLEIFDANGKSRFGKLAGEGFQLSYDYKGKTASAGAVGDAEVVGLVPGEIKTGRQSTTVITRTSDQVLEITSYFFVNEKTNKLMIQRMFKNISPEPVFVKTMLEYLDPALVIGARRNLKDIGEKTAAMRSRLKTALITGDCQPAECPEERPPCPQPCEIQIKFDIDRLTVRNNPAGGPGRLILTGQGQFTVAPGEQVFTHAFLASPSPNY